MRKKERAREGKGGGLLGEGRGRATVRERDKRRVHVRTRVCVRGR